MTTLSVVLPTYNRQETLAATLASCLEFARSLPVEFIVVDDGSTDGTAAFLEGLTIRHAAFQTLSTANNGPATARNLGAARASGDILLFMGDDTRPTSPDFFKTHLRLHERFPDPTTGILGKVVWPRDPAYAVTYVMSLIQGEGQQQFGYSYLRPYARYDWRFFYTANVSIKRGCVDDWSADGFSTDFRCAAFEDGEFACRLAKKLGSFQVLYAPSSIAEHDHHYDVAGFISRQFAAGMMANVLIGKHPETTDLLRLAELSNAMTESADRETGHDDADLLAVIEGIFAAARLLERNGHLGSAAWHKAFLNAVFELAFLRGFIWNFPGERADRPAGYRHALDRFDARMAHAMELDELATVAPLTVARRRLAASGERR